MTDLAKCNEFLLSLAVRPGWCVPVWHLPGWKELHELPSLVKELRQRGYDVRLIEVERKCLGWNQVMYYTYCVLVGKI